MKKKSLFFVLPFALCLLLHANLSLAKGGPGSSCVIGSQNSAEQCIGPLTCQGCPKSDPNTTKGICVEPGKEYICPTSKFTSLEEIITSTVNYLFWLAIVACPLVIVIAAFMFLISTGDPGKTRLAKQMILWAVIGLAVILFSKLIQSTISSIITGS